MKKDEWKHSIYQRKQGDWVALLTLPKEKGEKRNRKAFYGSAEKEARDKMYQFIFDYENGNYIPKRKDTLIAFLNDYYSISKSHWQTTTQELYRMYIDKHFEPYFKQTRLVDIKPITLDKFYNERLTKNRKVITTSSTDGLTTITKEYPPVSENTVLKLNSFLKSALDYAVKNDYIKKNPADSVKLPKKQKYNPNIFTEDNFKALLDMVKGTDDEIPIILAAGCGMRRGEIFGLQWGDIDFNKRTINIERSDVRVLSNIEKSPKNESSKRVFKAPDYVIERLKYYKPIKAKESDKVIVRWKPSSYSERFKFLLRKNGLPRVRFHDLRHFNAIIMLKYGISDKVAAERLGHAQVSTLKNIYQHVLDEMDESAANKISNIFK